MSGRGKHFGASPEETQPTEPTVTTVTRSIDETLTIDGTQHRGGSRGSSKRSRSVFARGDLVGRYVLVDELGAGGMGVVWAAYDPDLDRKIALKVLRQDAYGMIGSEGRSRLLREARALARLDHPNVVAVHDVGIHQGQVWIAMEFVDGQTLDRWFAGEDGQSLRPWREVVDVMLQAGRGLEAAHAKGLVHRDFKPANVMLGSDGRVRVMDFGLVHGGATDPSSQEDAGSGLDPSPKQAQSSGRVLGADLTRAGAVIGTPRYMAPEQYRGRSTDARTDQFAYCISLWLGLYGERPFSGDTFAQLAYQVTEGKRRPPPPGVEVPAWLTRFVLRGLAVDPSDRWPSIHALLEAITAELGRQRSVLWRGLVVGAGLVVLGGGLWGWQEVERVRTVEACEQAGQALAGLWTGEVRARAEASFATTGLPFADESWVQTARVIDTWVASWSELRTRLCGEAELDHRWTETQYEVALDCFAMREAELAARLEIYAAADESVVPGAVALASRMTDPARCLDASYLAHQLVPDDEDIHAGVKKLRVGAIRIEVLVFASRYDEALAQAEGLQTSAEALGWAPASAEALYALASVKNQMGEHDAGLELHEQAFFLATEIGHDAIAARAAASIVGILARKADYDDAMHWGRLGEAFLVRAGLDGSVEEGMLLSNVGNVYMDREEHEQALAAFERAVALWEAQLGPDHPNVGVGLTNLGVELGKLGRDDEAEAAYLRAHGIFEHTYGPSHPIIAMALINIGTIHSGRHEWDKARELQHRAAEILERSFGPDDSRITGPLNNEGIALQRLGKPHEALALYRRVLEIREKVDPNHPRVVGPMINIALVLHQLGQDEEAIGYADRALAISLDAFGEDHSKVAGSRYVQGVILRALGRLDEAKASLELALAQRLGSIGPEHENTALTRYQLARVEAELGHGDEARSELEQALPLIADTSQYHGARFELARLDYEAGRHEQALAEIRELHRQLTTMTDAEDVDNGKRRRLPEIEAWLAAHESAGGGGWGK